MLRIAITGPESTGKSTLTAWLANHYHTGYAEEYAREYIDKLNKPYTADDVEAIAHGQLIREKEILPTCNRIMFTDTELLVIKIWYEHAYGSCPRWIHQAIKAHPYHLYLLMDTDLPWEYDPQREHPHLRRELFHRYHEELKRYGFNHVIISGHGRAREEMALNAVEQLIQQHHAT
jgi:NadR type nicotinamide-nucleotide adenylyltransferase